MSEKPLTNPGSNERWRNRSHGRVARVVGASRSWVQYVYEEPLPGKSTVCRTMHVRTFLRCMEPVQ